MQGRETGWFCVLFLTPGSPPPHRLRVTSAHSLTTCAQTETLWPKRGSDTAVNTIFALKERAWDTVERVTIGGGERCGYGEHVDCDYDLLLSSSTFTIKPRSSENRVKLPCRPLKEEVFRKAKFLSVQVHLICKIISGCVYTLYVYRPQW